MKNKSVIKADLKRNRLQITLRGWLSKKDIQEVYTEIRFCVADLKPGFVATTDFTDCRIGYLSGVSTFIKMREYLQEKGIGAAIRIAGKKQLVFHQLSKIVCAKCDYPIIYVSSQEEAEQALAEAEKGSLAS